MKADIPQIVRRDLNEQTYEAIKSQILTRRLPGGQKVGLEMLATELGVSRTPVHHALMRLAAEGLMVHERRAYRVKPITADIVEHCYDARLVLELHGADEAVGQVGDADLERLRELVRRICPPEDRTGDVAEQHDAKRRFHELQIDLAGNPTVSSLYRSLALHELGQRTLPILGADIIADWQHEIGQIMAGYDAEDLDMTRAALIAHVENGKRRMRQAIENAGGAL